MIVIIILIKIKNIIRNVNEYKNKKILKWTIMKIIINIVNKNLEY